MGPACPLKYIEREVLFCGVDLRLQNRGVPNIPVARLRHVEVECSHNADQDPPSDHACTRQMGSMGVPRIPIGYERAARLTFRSGHFNIKFRLLECDLVSASFEPKDYPVCSNYASPDSGCKIIEPASLSVGVAAQCAWVEMRCFSEQQGLRGCILGK